MKQLMLITLHPTQDKLYPRLSKFHQISSTFETIDIEFSKKTYFWKGWRDGFKSGESQSFLPMV